MKKRLFVVLLLLVTWLSALPALAQSSPPLLGSTVAGALRTDLFSFFHLEPVGDIEDGWQNFRPQAAAFRMLACVRVKIQADRIEALELRLSRSFIEDKRNGRFAGDLAKSFLQQAVGEKDGKALSRLVEQIWRPTGAVVPGFDVYRGAATEWNFSGECQLILRNEADEFRARVTPSP